MTEEFPKRKKNQKLYDDNSKTYTFGLEHLNKIPRLSYEAGRRPFNSLTINDIAKNYSKCYNNFKERGYSALLKDGDKLHILVYNG